jgi:hypothetical protein
MIKVKFQKTANEWILQKHIETKGLFRENKIWQGLPVYSKIAYSLINMLVKSVTTLGKHIWIFYVHIYRVVLHK